MIDQSVATGVDTGQLPCANDETVGALLRRAREQAGLSAADIAEALRFGVRQIEALEADRYDSLAGATLVRGMVRGYAKYLRMDVDALVGRLDSKVPRPHSDVRPPTNIGDAADTADIPSVSMRSIFIALTIAVGIGVGAYFASDILRWDERHDESTDPSLAVGQPSTAQPAITGAAQTVVSGVPAVSSTEVAQASSASGNAGASVIPGAPAAAEPMPAVPTGAEVASTPALGAEPLPQGLVLDFDGHSWVEVRDRTQTIVLSGEFGKGTQKSVSGRGPYQLWIGRASVVRVSYRGKPIDIKSRTREDVARLTVDAQDS